MSTPNQEFQPPPPPNPVIESKPPRPAKMMIVAVVIFVLGLVLAGLGIAKIMTGGVPTGLFIVFCGCLLFAFSFIRLPATMPDAPAPMSPLDRVAGMFYQPSAVFHNLRSYPRWLLAFVIIALLSAIYSTAFVQRVTPEKIIGFTVDKLAESSWLPPEAIEQAKANAAKEIQEAKTQGKKFNNALSSIAGVFVISAVFAGLYLLGMLAFGGRMNFWQAFSVAIYAALPVTIILKLLSLVLLYVKSPDDIHPMLNADNLVQDNLGLLVTPADHPILFVMASFIGLTSFYRIWLTATGLRKASYRASSGAAWGVTITLTLLFLLLGIGLAAAFGGFMS